MTVKMISTGTLIVNAAGTGFDDNSVDTFDSSGHVITEIVNGEIVKVVFNFGSSNADSSATLTIATRDTPADTIFGAAITWQTDITKYVKTLAVSNANAALTVTGNTFSFPVSTGSLKISCTGATDNDTVVVKIYYKI